MSHTISAYKDGKRFADLNFGGSNPDREIYKALKCEEFDGGCSGTAEEKDFSPEDLAQALEIACTERIRDFLKCCLEQKASVCISFW